MVILSNGISYLQKQHMMQELLLMKNLLCSKMQAIWACTVDWMLMTSMQRKTYK